ncbi:hypothetical protein KCP69_11285 [Salmonella enterica subsp. enterica]|nr:hypothetical protein KCP69_11285 [Salmonella enterica subsp. enterica]
MENLFLKYRRQWRSQTGYRQRISNRSVLKYVRMIREAHLRGRPYGRSKRAAFV